MHLLMTVIPVTRPAPWFYFWKRKVKPVAMAKILSLHNSITENELEEILQQEAKKLCPHTDEHRISYMLIPEP